MQWNVPWGSDLRDLYLSPLGDAYYLIDFKDVSLVAFKKFGLNISLINFQL